ncbi:hypothetical protein ON010_g18241 [Phytophthora cinnamomi]|nr:hypothetical protein ON010_g18241 [Phytophthora cinnamomi]
MHIIDSVIAVTETAAYRVQRVPLDRTLPATTAHAKNNARVAGAVNVHRSQYFTPQQFADDSAHPSDISDSEAVLRHPDTSPSCKWVPKQFELRSASAVTTEIYVLLASSSSLEVTQVGPCGVNALPGMKGFSALQRYAQRVEHQYWCAFLLKSYETYTRTVPECMLSVPTPTGNFTRKPCAPNHRESTGDGHTPFT